MAAAAIPRALTPTRGQAPRRAENELGHRPRPEPDTAPAPREPTDTHAHIGDRHPTLPMSEPCILA